MVLQKYADDLDDSLRLWRYMNFDQFVHILATEKLWLAPLSGMEDQREGEWIEVQASKHQGSVRQSYDHAAQQTVVSSWVRADRESLPMWNSYAPADTGIAISTDVRSLLRTLAGASIRDDAFYLMRVEYCDQPHTIRVAIPGSYEPMVCAKYKSSDFQYENEVRVVYSRSTLAITTPGVPTPAEPGKGTHIPIRRLWELHPRDVWLMQPAEPGGGTHTCVPIPLPYGTKGVIVDPGRTPGTYIRVRSIPALMKNGVYVSPRATPWMFETVQSIMAARGHCPSLVHKSALTHLFDTRISPPFRHTITY